MGRAARGGDRGALMLDPQEASPASSSQAEPAAPPRRRGGWPLGMVAGALLVGGIAGGVAGGVAGLSLGGRLEAPAPLAAATSSARAGVTPLVATPLAAQPSPTLAGAPSAAVASA